MNDANDLIGVGLAGMGSGGLLVGFLKFLGSRQVSQLDETLKTLTGAIRDLDGQIRDLREAHIGFAKDIGALREAQNGMKERIDGQANTYRERFDNLQQQINDLARGRPKK